MKKRKLGITTPLLAVTICLLVAANVLLGMILTSQSMNSIRSLMSSRMLDISNTAAGMIDGDKLEKLTKDDIGSDDYNEQLSILRAFQKNIELEYIYGIHIDGNDKFSFTIDPEEVSPGEFGEEIECTEALKKAAHGTASADERSHTDRWGTFYSAYSPVYNSNNEIVGIIGVDFSAQWYDERIRQQIIAVVAVCAASTVIGILMAVLLSSKLRKRFMALYEEMNSLSNDFDNLNRLIETDSDDNNKPKKSGDNSAPRKNDEINELGRRIHQLQYDLQHYLTYIHSQAYTDTMTGANNKSAYLNKVKEVEQHIEDGKAEFAVVVFDLNGLKRINDNYGHETGDEYIVGAAGIIKSVFGTSNIYRIGGDEFIAILENTTMKRIALFFENFDRLVWDYNKKSSLPVKLTVAKGASVFASDTDTSYNQVFKRADNAMYDCKCEYYKTHPDDSHR